jgi:hypothetical protein
MDEVAGGAMANSSSKGMVPWYRRPRNILLEVLVLVIVAVGTSAALVGRSSRGSGSSNPSGSPSSGSSGGPAANGTGGTGTGQSVTNASGSVSSTSPSGSTNTTGGSDSTNTTATGSTNTTTRSGRGSSVSRPTTRATQPLHLVCDACTTTTIRWVSLPDPSYPSEFEDLSFSAQVVSTATGDPVTTGTVTFTLTEGGQTQTCTDNQLESNGVTAGAGSAEAVCAANYSPNGHQGAEWSLSPSFTAQATYVPTSSATQASTSQIQSVDGPSGP